jgi:glutamate 5-kinase
VSTKINPQKALAAIGQGRLIALWDNLFGQLEQPIAQVLLTRGDISDVIFFLIVLAKILTSEWFELISSAQDI